MIQQRKDEAGQSYTALEPKAVGIIVATVITALLGTNTVTRLTVPRDVQEVMDVGTVEAMIQEKMEYKSPVEVDAIVADILHERDQDQDIAGNTEQSTRNTKYYRDIQGAQTATQDQQMAINAKIDDLETDMNEQFERVLDKLP